MDGNKASSCFHVLLVYLEEQWNQSIQENNILQAPDFAGMQHYLMVVEMCCYFLGACSAVFKAFFLFD